MKINQRNSKGEKEELQEWYYENGKLMSKENFVNGILHGKQKQY